MAKFMGSADPYGPFRFGAGCQTRFGGNAGCAAADWVGALHCGMITMLAIIGVASLNWDSNSDFHRERVPAAQALFALLLLSFVVIRCVANWRRAASMPRRDSHDFDRFTTRSVYGLLYFLLGYQLLRDIACMGSLHVERCRFFVACGIVSVIIVRAAASLQRRLNVAQVSVQRV